MRERERNRQTDGQRGRKRQKDRNRERKREIEDVWKGAEKINVSLKGSNFNTATCHDSFRTVNISPCIFPFMTAPHPSDILSP